MLLPVGLRLPEIRPGCAIRQVKRSAIALARGKAWPLVVKADEEMFICVSAGGDIDNSLHRSRIVIRSDGHGNGIIAAGRLAGNRSRWIFRCRYRNPAQKGSAVAELVSQAN